MDAHRPLARAVPGSDDQLKPDADTVGHDQRGFERELGDLIAAGLVGCMQGEVDEGAGGEQDRARDGVVGKPGVGRQGELPGEQDGVTVGEGEGRGQQRMADGVQAGGGDVVPGGRGQPVALALEGVGGQVRASGGRAEHGGPVGADAVDVQVGQ